MNYIFDFDGVLVDSMPVWARTYVKMLSENGIAVPDGFVRRITPLGNIGAARCVIEAGLRFSAEEIVDKAMNIYDFEYSHNVPLKPNVAETLIKLKKAGNTVNVLTGSSHRYVDPCLKRHGVFDLFANVWSVDDFPFTKADVRIYKEAAKRLSTDVTKCIFFDDNPDAVAAAKKAGMPTVAVYDSSSAEFADRMKATADRYISDFSEII